MGVYLVVNGVIPIKKLCNGSGFGCSVQLLGEKSFFLKGV